MSSTRIPVVTALLVVAALVSLPAAARDRLDWGDPGKALARAKAESMPAMISWETTWCPYCKKMRKETWADPGVMASLQGFVRLIGDAEKFEPLANRYGVDIYPTVVFTAPSGAPILALRGYQGAADMTDRILAIWKDRERLYDLADRADGKRPDGAALVGLASFATEQASLPYAEILLRRAVDLQGLDPAAAAEARLKLAAILVLTDRCEEALPVVSGVPRPVPEAWAERHEALSVEVGRCAE